MTIAYNRKFKTHESVKDKLKDKDWYPCVHCGGRKRYEVWTGPCNGDYSDHSCDYCSNGTWTKERFQEWYKEAQKKQRKDNKIASRREQVLDLFIQFVKDNKLCYNDVYYLEHGFDSVFGSKRLREFIKTLKVKPWD